MNELALFAGAGGGILGGKLLGWRTVCAVELDPYARAILAERQNDGCLAPFPVWDDIRTFDGRPWAGIVAVVSGGCPSQDISVAGKGAGLNGARSGLWGEMRRIVGEVRPRHVFVENSPALTSRGLGTVLGDLAALGYDARWGVLGAVDAGAPHRRERIWIVATANHTAAERQREPRGQRLAMTTPILAGESGESTAAVGSARSDGSDTSRQSTQTGDFRGILGPAAGSSSVRYVLADAQEQHGPIDGPKALELGRRGEDVADAGGGRFEIVLQRDGGAEKSRQQASFGNDSDRCGEALPDADFAGCQELHATALAVRAEFNPGHDAADRRGTWWSTEPELGRVADGVAHRVDRLRAIGNGQVPAVAALAWRLLSGV